MFQRFFLFSYIRNCIKIYTSRFLEIWIAHITQEGWHNMSKGLGKFVLFCAAAGAAAAGVYYYLNKKDGKLNEDSEDDDFDDFDDFDDDTDSTSDEHGRGYVNIGHGSKETNHSDDKPDESTEDESDAKADETPDETEEFFDDDDESADK